MNLTPDRSATLAPSGEPEFSASERNLNLLSERDFAPFVPPRERVANGTVPALRPDLQSDVPDPQCPGPFGPTGLDRVNFERRLGR